MPQFDPRRSSFHLAPRLFVAAAGFAALGVGLSLHHAPPAKPVASRPAPPRNAAANPPAPVQMLITVRSGETLQAAVQRTGVSPDQARQAVAELGKAFDTVHIKAGLSLQAAVLHPLDRDSPMQLVGLSLRASPVKSVTLSRGSDGGFRAQAQEEKVRDETTVAKGQMNGSLYESAEAAGATPTLTAEVAKLFSHKLDFSRDIQPGDAFKLVFDRKVTESGRTVAAGDLLYAEIDAKGRATRFYRFKEPGAAKPEFFDEAGKNIKGFLLKTPVDGARVTSGFGMRMHPILGYTRMHQGIDFGVPTGTPVYAAGDGVVEEARWAGGYGRWMKLRHNGGWETAYGHLSGWAVRAGQHVHQGQVIAYSGSTGESTGPHLHYEVMNAGRKIDPKSAKVPAGTILAGRELAAFKAEKAHVDKLLAADPQGVGPRNLADAGTVLLR